MNKPSYYMITLKECAENLKSDLNYGLTQKEAQKRLASNGKNVLRTQKQKNIVEKFFMQFNDFMTFLLLAAAVVSFVTSLFNGEADFIEPLIIIAIIVLNALLGVIQENRAQKSIEALKKLCSPHTTVIRDGQEINIDSSLLCPGDIIKIRSGDVVCADCRLISSIDLCIDESSLTGESIPVYKDSNYVSSELVPLGDRRNMIYSSTSVIGGKGTAIVTATGMNSEMGKIAFMLTSDTDVKTPLQEKLAETGKTLGISALVICVIIFIIGLTKHIAPLEMFVTSVSLAVAAIPEGLPAIVTIMLAIGIMKMSAKNAIVRNLPSVETLGSASVICSDKTGTLTQNKMKVTTLHTHDNLMLLRLASLCCTDANNPTDSAIIAKTLEDGIDINILQKKYKLISETPFSSQTKLMSVTRKHNTVNRTIIKGAPEYVLSYCERFYNGTKTVPLSKGMRDKINSENKKMTSSGLRVIGVAYCDDQPDNSKDFIFVGLIGISDPPRPEVKESVLLCKKAGIIPVMITGDHIGTAISIAKQTGILENEKSMTGEELDKLSDSELCKIISEYRVFARVTPSHKVRIVKAWQASENIVAMTGDGVNDAPALSTADIGCAMGKKGTEVAKNSSDLILTDDNFSTIVNAVYIGRGIFDNIKKAIKFLLSSNIGEILTVFSGIIFGYSTPLTAIELLWINLVTDSLPAIALGLDPYDKNTMTKPPRPKNQSLFYGGLWSSIIMEGLMIGALALFAFSAGCNIFDDFIIGQTMSFAVLSLSQLVHAFNMRSEQSVIKAGLFKNKYLILSFIIGTILEVCVIQIPFIAQIFGVIPLDLLQWIIVAVLSAMPLGLVELQKLVSSKEN